MYLSLTAIAKATMSQVPAACPELIFLRACCARNASPAELSGLLERPFFEWETLRLLAEKEQLSCLLYKSIKILPEIASRMPGTMYARLKETYYHTAARAVESCRQLESLAAHFQAQGLEFLLLKGLALSEGIYHDIGIRSSCDIDILVRKEDLSRVDRLLGKLGYRLPFSLSDFGAINVNAYRNSFFYLGKTETILPVHLYWHLINTVGVEEQVLQFFSMDALREEAVGLQMGSVRVRTLCPHHQVIYLSLHAFAHSFRPFLLLCDIHELIRDTKDPLVWSGVVKDARRFGLSRYVGYALEILARTLNTEVPRQILTQLAPRKTASCVTGNLDRIARGQKVSFEEWMLAEALRKSPKEALIFLWQAVFPGRRSLALLKQKSPVQISIVDYIQRIFSALRGAAQAIVPRSILWR